VDSRLILDVVVIQGAPVLQPLTSEYQALLISFDALFVLDLLFDVFDGIRRLQVQEDVLASQGLNEYLHCCFVLGFISAFLKKRFAVKQYVLEMELKN
jgi:hypothetical protein